MKREIIGAQGEITIFRISEIPADIETKPAERTQAGHIISHSESGNHHVLTGGEVMERVNDVPAGMKMLYAICESPEELVQDAPGKPHAPHSLPAGLYEFRIAREYDPFAEQSRIVAD
jgi:hypothetical protein